MALLARNTEKLGGIAIHKGKDNKETPIVMWDAIPKCDIETCPIGESCPYPKTGHCSLRQVYQKHVVECVLENALEIDAEKVLKIGMHLIPLYAQLIMFKIHALDAPVMVVSRGSLKPNPIFAEIREIIKAITVMLRELGLNGDPVLRGGKLPHNPDKGSLSYYDQMTKEQ